MRMGPSYTRQLGMTLLEVMLVIAIAGSLLLLGIQTYYQFALQGEMTKINFNVNVLFQAMRSYYYANCIANRDYTNSGTQITTGAMDPTSSNYTSPSGSNLALDITTNLVSPGFLANWHPNLSPIATNYVVQFNLYRSTRNISFCYSGSCASVATNTANTIYLWTIQVAVKVDSTKATQYQNLLGANCVSSLENGIVAPCTGTQTASDYIVFERLPSFASTSANSPLWLSDPVLKLFKRQYTNDDDYAVTKGNDTNYFSGSYQNYLCGG